MIIQVSSNDADVALEADADGFLHTGVKSRPDDVDIWEDRHQQAFAWFERRTISSSRFLTWLRILQMRAAMRKPAGGDAQGGCRHGSRRERRDGPPAPAAHAVWTARLDELLATPDLAGALLDRRLR